jgi:cytochrome c oxidase subunit 3
MAQAVTDIKVKRIHPKKFALWMALVSIVMFFSAFTSAYIVRKAAGNWLSFPLPIQFYISTFFILSSSVFFYLSKRAYQFGNLSSFKKLFYTGFVLGILFCILQYFGWEALNKMDINLSTNQSSSFFFLITYAHLLHVLGGIAALVLTIIGIQKKHYNHINEKRLLKLDLTFTYWHFVDLLWLYLFLFLIFQS